MAIPEGQLKNRAQRLVRKLQRVEQQLTDNYAGTGEWFSELIGEAFIIGNQVEETDNETDSPQEAIEPPEDNLALP